MLSSLVYARDAYTKLLVANLSGPHQVVTSCLGFSAAVAKRQVAVAYVDCDLLPQIQGDTAGLPIVGIFDGSLEAAVRLLVQFPWLSHLVSPVMLSAPGAKASLGMVRHRIDCHGTDHHVLSANSVGRAALVAASNRRESRIERVREYFEAQNASAKTIARVTDVAEELIVNALYDAPVEAGYFMTPVERTADVELPPERACELSYGLDDGYAFVRCRDPFGALTRHRLASVLERCNTHSVSLDESRGGAGLGLWRIFSSASSIAIVCIPGQLTDIIVWFELRTSRTKNVTTEIVPLQGGSVSGLPSTAPSARLQAVQLFFPQEHARDSARGRFAADHDYDLIDESFTALLSS